MSGSQTWLVIAGAAIATYVTRFAGYAILTRFHRLHPRVEAALNAVPAAVLSTIVAPGLLTGGPSELAALAVAGLTALRFGLLQVFLAGGATLILLRALAGA